MNFDEAKAITASAIRNGLIKTPEPARTVSVSAINDCAPLPLTAREKEVLEMVCRGMTTSQIAIEMGVGARTVDSFRQHIAEKLFASRRSNPVAMFIRAIQLGLVPCPCARKS